MNRGILHTVVGKIRMLSHKYGLHLTKTFDGKIKEIYLHGGINYNKVTDVTNNLRHSMLRMS